MEPEGGAVGATQEAAGPAVGDAVDWDCGDVEGGNAASCGLEGNRAPMGATVVAGASVADNSSAVWVATGTAGNAGWVAGGGSRRAWASAAGGAPS